MNSDLGTTPDYYSVLPASVLSTGVSIGGSSGFTATSAGTVIGIASNMINGFPTHNNFTSVASALTVFEDLSGVAISIGISDATITGGGIGSGGPATPVPTLSTWALLLLVLLVGGIAYAGLGRRFSR